MNKSHNTAVGPDEIYNQILKQLMDESVIWTSDPFSESWRQTIIVPIPKINKDTFNPLNYQAITLTSCLCKMIERMINNRLTWYLESNGLITDLQSGFCKKRGTEDCLPGDLHLGSLHKKAAFGGNVFWLRSGI